MDEQPLVSDADWLPLLNHETFSKFPVLADVEAARVRLAQRFNRRPLPKQIQVDLAWKEAISLSCDQSVQKCPRKRCASSPKWRSYSRALNATSSSFAKSLLRPHRAGRNRFHPMREGKENVRPEFLRRVP
jgi:hypothetical protein